MATDYLRSRSGSGQHEAVTVTKGTLTVEATISMLSLGTTSSAGAEPKQVAIKLPNELGLHDISGNVWEWIEDAFTNGRRHRSGSWTDPASNCRITARGGAPETYASDIVGFRVARNAD